MRRYVVLIAYEPWDWSTASAQVRQQYADDHDAFHHYVDTHGRRLSSAALGGADTATSVGPGPSASRVVTDGPYTETTEQVGGYYDVELPDLDHVLAAARLLPPAYTLEIRPVVGVEGYEEG